MSSNFTRRRRDLIWVMLGLAAVAALFWSFPRAYPLFPTGWTVSKEEAVDIALERIRDLGELPAAPYVLTHLDASPVLEPMLQASDSSATVLRASAPGRELMVWQVVVHRSLASGPHASSVCRSHGSTPALRSRQRSLAPRSRTRQTATSCARS